MSHEEHHRFIHKLMDRQTDIARKLIGELEARNAALAAENERLRKAGDRLASATIIFEMMSEEDRVQRRADWLAAKEGTTK